MSDYPAARPDILEDVYNFHIVGKVTEVSQRNSIWLRDALDIALERIAELEAAVETQKQYLDNKDSVIAGMNKMIKKLEGDLKGKAAMAEIAREQNDGG